MIIAEEHGLVLEYFVLGHMFITNYYKIYLQRVL